MTDDLVDGFLHTVEQDFLAQALTVQHTRWFEDQACFDAMLAFAALVVRHEARDGEGIFLCLIQIDDLAVGMGLKGCERRQEIYGFKDGRLALCVGAGKQNDALGQVDIQACETAEIGEGEMFEEHYFIGARLRSVSPQTG